MHLKRIFTTGERATFRIAQEIADHHGVEALAKVRLADTIEIANGGISNEEYSYALKAHFDCLVVQNNVAVLAIEFDGSGHDPKNDHLKNRLCDSFGVPLVRVGMTDLNSKNFEDTAVHFLIYQLFCVDIFLEERSDPYEPYDPIFFSSVAGKKGAFPFHYSARWRNRLARHFKEHSHVFDSDLSHRYGLGLLHLEGSEGAWTRGDEIRAFCGQSIGGGKSVIGVAQMAFQVFGMSSPRREYFMRLHPFVIGLAASEMYDKALAFLDGDAQGLMKAAGARQMLDGWTAKASTSALV